MAPSASLQPSNHLAGAQAFQAKIDLRSVDRKIDITEISSETRWLHRAAELFNIYRNTPFSGEVGRRNTDTDL